MKQHLLPLLLLASLAGCSNAVETRVSSSGQAGVSPASFSYDMEQPKTVELQAAYYQVVTGLAAKGFGKAKPGALNLQVSLSSRPAQLTLATGSGTLSPAKKKKALQSCQDKEYRLLIILTQIADGSEIYRGSAAEYHCNMPMADAVPTLVNAALVDVGQPRGSYAVMRKAKD
jgi:hypothetical protein